MALITQLPVNLRLTDWQKSLIVLAFLVVLDVAGATGYLSRLVSRGLLPAQQLSVFGLNQVYSFWQAVQKLPKAAARIQDLELRLAESSASLAELETLRRENAELRFLLENTDRGAVRSVIAAPVVSLSRPAIAAGAQAGVVPGALVLSRNTLLGQVTKVTDYQAEITLLFTSEAQPVLAKTSSGVTGLVVGDGKKILFTQVSKESRLTVGDRVVTLGQPQIEQNLPIGQIVSVINDPVSSVQSAIIEQPVSFFATPVVEVR